MIDTSIESALLHLISDSYEIPLWMRDKYIWEWSGIFKDISKMNKAVIWLQNRYPNLPDFALKCYLNSYNVVALGLKN